MSLRNDIVSFWLWGYRGNLRTELQAPVLLHDIYELRLFLKPHLYSMNKLTQASEETVTVCLNANNRIIACLRW